MLLAIDSGNARVKWALADGERVVARGTAHQPDGGALADAWRALPPIARAIGCNVAGAQARAAIERAAASAGVAVEWIEAEPACCGVVNGYRDPRQLGADRWAALIAARRVVPNGACVVVDAGTALTADALTAAGAFRGGVIVPGLRLMREALAERTAQLRVPEGRYQPFPAATPEAIASGALLAIAGAVEGMARALLRAGERDPSVVLGGGDADALAPLIERPVERVGDLAIRGLIAIASCRAPARPAGA